MNIRKAILFLTAAAMVGCTGANGPLTICQTEPLVKILPSDTAFVDSPDTICVARGENAVFQFVLTSDSDIEALTAEISRNEELTAKIGWVHDVHNENPTSGADDMIVDPDNNYPDPIIDDEQEDLAASGHKTLWVDMAVPRDARPGLRTCRLTVQGSLAGKKVKVTKDFTIKVYPVTLPERQALDIVNWYTPNTIYHLADSGEKVDIDSDRYFELLKKVAEAGAEYGQNCWKIQARPAYKLNADGTDIDLDFTLFDKTIEMFKEHGNLRTFHITQIGGRLPDADWNEPFIFNIAYVEDGQIKGANVSYDDPRLSKYINTYFPILENHLREKGWLDICFQHIADEPAADGTKSQISWSAVAGMVKKAAPSLKTIDASSDIVENQDIGVILLGDNIDDLPPVPEGSERWLYTCTGPQGNFANRFIQLPLIKTRILHWINYRYNESGYLHWGFNYWDHARDTRWDVTPTTAWPGGDPFIIYPGRGKVYPSIRLSTMRDGIRDYDLLKMVEEADPKMADYFCRKVVFGPDKYELDVKAFRAIRKEMLEFLTRELDKPQIDYELVADLADWTPEDVEVPGWIQGLAVDNSYVFVIHSGGQVLIYNLEEKKLVSNFYLPDNTSHCNNAAFGIEKWNDESTFPLLYVTDCVDKGDCYVYDINLERAIEVQRIHLKEKPGAEAGGNGWFIDKATKRLGMHWQDGFWFFPIPDKGEKDVMLSIADRQPDGYMGLPAIHQGACAWNGYVFFPCGFNEDPYMTMADIETGEHWNYPLNFIGFEPEGACEWDGSLWVTHAKDFRNCLLCKLKFEF